MKFMVLPGDGVGPEIVDSAVAVLQAAGRIHKLELSLDFAEVGLASLARHGTTLREEVLQGACAYDGLVLGPQSHADYPDPTEGGRNISAAFRVGLDLYANVRPARSRPGVPTHMKAGRSMDLVVMREATEGFYPDRNMSRGWGEMMPTPDMALSVRKITRRGSERIARRAFELASRRRQQVTAVHKQNSFHMSDGLFLECCRAVAREFSGVAYDELLVDACTAHLVRTPERFDVLVMENFYGDILSDLASELAGGLGLAGSIMAGDQRCCAQVQHGSAPDLQGLNLANPTSMILSAAMLLEWLGEQRRSQPLSEASRGVQSAVDAVLARPETRTRDLGGRLGTREFTQAVIEVLVSG